MPHGSDVVCASRVRVLLALALMVLALSASRPAAAQECRVVAVDMTPSPDLQMVAWLEDAAGNYVDTVYITSLTGSYGLGNRPGMMNFNSGWRWPYGRRVSTFPIWSHRHGREFPLVVFQNLDESNLSHPLGQSSTETFYCRPLRADEPMWDTQTCASIIYTDKGMFAPTGDTSLYPPRRDIDITASIDHPDAQMFGDLNPFDAVSRATPAGDAPFQMSWPIPADFPQGDYVLWLEVSQEFDQNAFYDYPAPTGIPWSEYGLAYRGQPSVVYTVPFTIGTDMVTASTLEYAGYGDPDGIDGVMRAPDGTITVGVDGTGASRLMLTVDGQEMYRVRLRSQPTNDATAPQSVDDMSLFDARATSVTVSFSAPQDDMADEAVTGYEVRYMAGTEITEDNFADAKPANVDLGPLAPGETQYLTIDNLVPRSRYWVAVRPYDECQNKGLVTAIEVTTEEREVGEVSACFVATAAYGSALQRDVNMLRRFRDRFLRTHATGELLVEGYYTFGPGLARMIAPSDTARRAARASLEPLVEAIRSLAPSR